MNWQVSCNSTIGANGATDGDMDAAMALLIANSQWTNTVSPQNYSSLATQLITDIKNNSFETCGGRVIPTKWLKKIVVQQARDAKTRGGYAGYYICRVV